MSPPHPSALALHQYQAGALPAPQRDAAAAHLEGCPACRRQLAELAEDTRRFAAEVFPRTLAGVTARAAPERRTRWLLAPVLAAAVVALWLGRRPEVRVKGAATLTVVAAGRDGLVTVADGTTLEAGDRIRFVLRPAGLRYVLIAGVDGAGRATIYHPFQGSESGPLAGAVVEIPGSIVLDRSPGPERIFALLSSRPLPAAPLRDALAALGRGGPGAIRATRRLAVTAAVQETVLFEKR
jgi:hypothetical protein